MQTAPAIPSRDPLAVGVANASLLGMGYVMLGRRRLAVGTGMCTVVLVILLATVVRSVWFEVVVLLWWVALAVHGWYLAGGRRRGTRQGGRKQWVIALGVTVPVLLAICLLRFDASRIERDTAEARGNGDCTQALAGLDRLWVGHRVVDAPLAAHGDDTVQACGLLKQATTAFDTALTGDIAALEIGFDRLFTVLEELPGHEKMVETVLGRFLDRLPTGDACDTTAITDWLGRRPAVRDVLYRAVAIVARIAPAALIGCGDALMTAKDFQQARARFQQVLDEYPNHDLAATAKEGVVRATQAIELANLRRLLQPPSHGAQPAYCSGPAQYSGAAPYGGNGPNRAQLFGNGDMSPFPGDWLAHDAADAVLVICAGRTEFGAPIETCTYEYDLGFGQHRDVTFRKKAIPVRAYEVRTGRLVIDTRVEIGGASCPDTLPYTTSRYIDTGPPSEVYVTSSESDVRAAFESLINP